MKNIYRTAVAAVLLVAAPMVLAQSPGSVESELKYAQEYLDAGKWDYAMWRYEGILRQDPENAEALQGYEVAKARLEAQRAAQREMANRLDAARNSGAASRSSGPISRPSGRSGNSARSSTTSSKQAHCDNLFGSCWATEKSPNCFIRRNMCYTQNGIKY